MTKKLAIKRLRSSDLGFFNSYLAKGLTKAKQKGFNLDKAVLEGEFFPSLSALLTTKPKKALHLDLLLSGPAMRSTESLSRKIKIDAKNFRLNGEVINNPLSEPNRYDSLAAGDFAIFEFVGNSEPSSVKALLIAAAETEDRALHAALTARFPQGSMHLLSVDDVSAVIAAATPDATHPIRAWAEEAPLEEVAAGGADAIERLNRKRVGRGLSLEDLQDAKAAAELTGQRGEGLVNQFLAAEKLAGLLSYEWTSSENAIAPFDFKLMMNTGTRNVDVKSTSGPFENPIHLSLAEIRVACSNDAPYDLFRVFGVNTPPASLRIARDIGPTLQPLLRLLDSLPTDAIVDSVSFKPSFFQFEKEQYDVEGLDEGEEDISD